MQLERDLKAAETAHASVQTSLAGVLAILQEVNVDNVRRTIAEERDKFRKERW
jgi:hypothetical protein